MISGNGSSIVSDRYHVVSELGRGGMGVVYLAEDMRLKRQVALKVLYRHLGRKEDLLERFRGEAQSVSSLHHTNVVCVHGLEFVGDELAIDMEYVPGTSLSAFVGPVPVSSQAATRIACDILEGLVACHRIGIVHRDIKPGNILITNEGVAKITDFGLATAYALHVRETVHGAPSSGLFMGTPRYAPPAAWDGRNAIPSWDLYSLGVILFELLSGRVAFPGETPMAIMRQHLDKALSPVADAAPTASPRLAAAIQLLLDSEGKDTSLTSQDVLRAFQETPEFGECLHSDTASTVSVILKKRRRLHAGHQFRIWAWRAYHGAAVTILAAVALVWLTGGLKFTPQPIPGVAPGLDLAADLTSPLFLRAESAGGALVEGAMCMISRDSEGRLTQIHGLGDQGLWHLALEPGERAGSYRGSGGWGGYFATAGSGAQYGTLSGEVHTGAGGQTFSLFLERRNQRDNRTDAQFLLTGPPEEPYDPPRFIREFEFNGNVQSLLYNELIPRQLRWAENLEAIMPSFEGGRFTLALSDKPVTIDGAIDTGEWGDPLLDQPGGEQSGAGGNQFRARWMEGNVIFAFTASGVSAASELELCLLAGVDPGENHSRRFTVRVGSSGLISAESTSGDQAIPWTSDWQAAATEIDGVWRAEVQIPLATFQELYKPKVGHRWRMNARLQGVSPESTPVVWGYEDTQAVEHGLILQFVEEAP